MPALTNPRHERFARYYMRTGNAAASYLKAGYEPTTRNALDVNACRLLRHSKVRGRIRELQRQMATRNRITVDSLLDDLQADRALARELGQTAAAIQATQLSAKLVGLLVDRKESGAPGDFAALQTADDVMAVLRAELGDNAAKLLGAALSEALPVPDMDATRDPDATVN